MTPDEVGGAAAELRDVVEVLREYLQWQSVCGAIGVPRSSLRRLEVPAHVDQPAVAEPAPVPRPAARITEPRGAGADEPSRAADADKPREAVVRQLVAVPHVAADKRPAMLAVMADEVKGCTLCGLHTSRTQTVFSRGNPSAEVMIVGEGPGAEEDAQGEPFVGPAGQLLDRMIGAMGYGRDDVYIANVVKCRPPDNRTPQAEETQACMPYLHKQIEIVSPRVILAMGNTAVRGLLGASEGIMRLRGKWKLYKGRIPVMPTYHPAYLLRQEAIKRDAKREVWNDLKAVLAALGRTVPLR